MQRELDITAVLGSGEQGLNWAHNQRRKCFAVDNKCAKSTDLTTNVFTFGDSLCLPFKNNAIYTIYSDFLLNAVQAGNFLPKDVVDNPEILSGYPFPQTVCDWYRNVLKRQFRAERDLKNVRWLLREVAIKEMWRILAFGGRIIIVDHKDVVQWICDQSPTMLATCESRLVIAKSNINDNDLARSSSLVKLLRQGATPQKIILQKISFSIGPMGEVRHRSGRHSGC